MTGRHASRTPRARMCLKCRSSCSQWCRRRSEPPPASAPEERPSRSRRKLLSSWTDDFERNAPSKYAPSAAPGPARPPVAPNGSPKNSSSLSLSAAAGRAGGSSVRMSSKSSVAPADVLPRQHTHTCRHTCMLVHHVQQGGTTSC